MEGQFDLSLAISQEAATELLTRAYDEQVSIEELVLRWIRAEEQPLLLPAETMELITRLAAESEVSPSAFVATLVAREDDHRHRDPAPYANGRRVKCYNRYCREPRERHNAFNTYDL